MLGLNFFLTLITDRDKRTHNLGSVYGQDLSQISALNLESTLHFANEMVNHLHLDAFSLGVSFCALLD